MSGGFELDPDVLTTAAATLDTHRAQLHDATSGLRTTVDGADNPWGADEQGSAFAGVYQETLTWVLDAMATHEDQLDYAAQSLRASAEAHVQNDDAVRARFAVLGGTS